MSRKSSKKVEVGDVVAKEKFNVVVNENGKNPRVKKIVDVKTSEVEESVKAKVNTPNYYEMSFGFRQTPAKNFIDTDKVVENIPTESEIKATLSQVEVTVVADDPKFVPKYENLTSISADLFANIPVDVSGNKQLTLTSRTMGVIDTGFSLELPENWKVEVTALPCWSKKGLVIMNSQVENRISVQVANLGKEILVINDGDKIAQMHPTPVYRFVFK